MDFKINSLEFKKNILNQKVRKYNGLANLYKDYIEFLKEETNSKIDKKVLNFQTKLFSDFQKQYVDVANRREIFEFVFNADYEDLKKKKRLEFRAFREKTNRKIAKLTKLEGSEAEIEELKNAITDFEALKNEEVEEIANSWKEKFEAEISQIEQNNPDEEAISLLKEEINNQIKDYRVEITEKLQIQLENKIAKIEHKIEKLNNKYEINKEKLTEYLEVYTELMIEKVRLENEKELGNLEVRIQKAEANLEKFKAKLEIANPNQEEKLKNEIVKCERLIEDLKVQLTSLTESINEDKALINDDEILNIQGLCMYFGGIKAVNNLSFSVKKNEIFGLIGPNGAGKTTVFNCITQFYKPTRGKITFRNKNNEIVNLVNEKVHNVILQGVIRTFQNLEVIKDITVLDNLLIAAHRNYTSNIFQHMFHTPLLSVEEKVITKRAQEVLEFMGLTKYKDMYAWGLPYGILKKIEIARTLMCNPQLIILDEPAAGLNDSETVELTEIIRKIRDKYDSTILLVEHDMGLVMTVCDRICAISFGNLLGLGTPSEIQQNKAVQEAYLGVSED